MAGLRQELPVSGGLLARLVFTDRLVRGPGGSSRAPFQWGNLASHVGDDPMAVAANRTDLAGLLDLPAERMTFMHPDHGRGVAAIETNGRGGEAAATGVAPGAEIQAVDALVTSQPSIGLVALAADCVPIVLVEPRSAIVAAVHAGWRGVALNVIAAALDRIETLGGDPGNVQAFLGPAICANCYPVSAQRRAEVAAAVPAAAAATDQGEPAVDLRAGLTAQLVQRGARVTVLGGCCAEDPDYFSYRRDGLTGRQAGAVVLLAGRR